jgi:clan AA aspartic protease (TIGR02281 family)
MIAKSIYIVIITTLLFGPIQSSFGQKVIQMKKEGGVYTVPCSVNGLPLKFIFDTGASNVSISLTEAMFLMKNGLLTDEDILEVVKFSDATGKISEGTTINIRELEFSGLILNNVKATIVHQLNAPLLLGQSAMAKFGKFQFDPNMGTLTILNNSTETNIKRPKYIRASEAYGYLIGQEYSLDYIKKKFPELELNIDRLQISFNLNFGKSKEALRNYLSNIFSDTELEKHKESLVKELNRQFANQTFTEDDAIAFLLEVDNRAKGNIASPVLETILSFQYADRPHGEFLAGFTTLFKTKGHPKSKGTDWQIRVPKSWRAEEADRPNIIQKFLADQDDTNQSIMLMVLPFPEGHPPTKAELDELFTDKGSRSIVPEKGKFISFTKMTLDNNIGGMLVYEQTTSRMDFTITVRMAQFMFIKATKIYVLQGTVGADNHETDLSLEMQKYLPLYRLVANSIVVNDQYRQ